MLRWWQIKKRDADLERELQSDLELEEDEQRESGLPPEEAHYAARRALGNAALIRERTHEAWGWAPFERLWQDVRYGTRSLLKCRGFTAAAVITLALGIGANTAMFSLIRSVLLKPWPIPDSGRVMLVSQRQANGAANLFSTPDFLDWRQQGGLLSRMGAHVNWQFDLGGAGSEPERVSGGEISSDLLPVLGVQPILGRVFSSREDLPGSGNFVLLSFALWNERYGADREIVGKTIQIGGAPYTVVGVMAPGFNGLDGKQLLWTPLQLRRDSEVGSSPNLHWLGAFIRLPAGESLKQARVELNANAARLHRENPGGDLGFGVYLQTLNDAFTQNVRPALFMLMGCVGLVLLIACANVANLLLARGASRMREMAVRTALGASPARIIRQLLTESILLASAGGAAGIGIAFLLLRGMLAIHPPNVPRIDQTTIDGPVLAFTSLVSIAVGILFGLVPAVFAARTDFNSGLREHSGPAGHGISRQRSVLVISETALACMLLIGTALALRSLWSLRKVELGFNPRQVLTFQVAAPSQLRGAQIPDFYRQIVQRIRAVPGVQSAALARDLPLSGIDPSMPIQTEGKYLPPLQGQVVTRYRTVGADYFSTLGIALLRGRSFHKDDSANSPEVTIVSKSLAQEYWPNESPIGKRIKPKFAGAPWCTVVGEVADVRHWGSGVQIEPTAYYPYSQVPDSMRSLIESNMSVAVRSSLVQTDLAHSIKAVVASLNPNIAPYNLQSMDSMLAQSGSLRDFDLILLCAFSFLALCLAAVGVYAVMAYSVAQRTQELGVRMALGAHRTDILLLVFKQGARLAAAGAGAGVVGAVCLRKLMAGYLYGLSSSNAATLLMVPVVMIVIVLMACWIPARRAAKIDPMRALRYE